MNHFAHQRTFDWECNNYVTEAARQLWRGARVAAVQWPNGRGARRSPD